MMLAAYKEAESNTKRIFCKCANDVHTSADSGNICAVYEGLKNAFSPSAIKIPWNPSSRTSS